MQEEQWLVDLRNFVCDEPDPNEFIDVPHMDDKIRKAISEGCKGRIPYNKGIPHTEETKQKISRSNTGKVSYWKGKKQPAEMVAKMIANLPNRKGSANARARTYLITFIDGRTECITSLQTWAVENGYVPTSVRNLYNGRQTTPHKDIMKVTPL